MTAWLDSNLRLPTGDAWKLSRLLPAQRTSRRNLPELGVSRSDERLIGPPAIVTWFALRKPRPSPMAPNAGLFRGMRLSRRPVEVTAVSRICGTQRIQEDTKGHGEVGG